MTPLTLRAPHFADALVKKFDGIRLKGQSISIEPCGSRTEIESQKRDSRKLLIGNIPFDVDGKTIRSLVSKYGEVLQLSLRQKQGNPSYCLVTMKTEAQAIDVATSLHLHLLESQEISVTRAGQPSSERPATKEGREVFVTNLSKGTRSSTILNLFSQIGYIEDIRMKASSRNRRKHSCFMTFTSSADAQAAVKRFHETAIDRRVVSVTVAVPSKTGRRVLGTIRVKKEVLHSNTEAVTIEEE